MSSRTIAIEDVKDEAVTKWAAERGITTEQYIEQAVDELLTARLRSQRAEVFAQLSDAGQIGALSSS